MIRVVRLISQAAAAGLLLAVSAPALPALASTTSASACLNGYSGPYDLVNSYAGINLKCGDPSKGVLHIDASHPIATNGRDDVHVDRCMDNILAYGRSVTANPGNTAKRITRSSGGYAQIVWDSRTKDVITMYTSDSNNWTACAAYPN
jgi:hypothetical protein